MSEQTPEQCGQIDCCSEATFRMYWPGGQPLLVCDMHREAAAKIVRAMGLYLHVEKLGASRG